MIKPAAGNLLLRDGDGLRTFHARDLRDRIARCCRDAGMRDPWVAGHIAAFIEDYLQYLQQNGDALPSTTGLDRMVAQVLVDAGYPEVAAGFVQNSGLTPFLDGDSPRGAWDRTRIEQVLRRNLPLHPLALQRLAELTAARLERLGIDAIADSLIVQVARHVAPSSAGPPGPPPSEEDAPWLLRPDRWQDEFPTGTAPFVHCGALEIKPVSRLLPAPRLRLDLERLGKRVQTDPLTQLAFYPLLVDCCRAATLVARRIQTCIAEADTTGLSLPAALEVRRLEVLLQKRFTALSKVGRVRTAAEIRDLVGRFALKGITPSPAVVFRP
ncbi:MAG: hypothetical protein GXP31_09120 [Kiritimatiellaeota bacterium]|nr:hypothetical protein [Kiritimatiellota bacterium]